MSEWGPVIYGVEHQVSSRRCSLLCLEDRGGRRLLECCSFRALRGAHVNRRSSRTCALSPTRGGRSQPAHWQRAAERRKRFSSSVEPSPSATKTRYGIHPPPPHTHTLTTPLVLHAHKTHTHTHTRSTCWATTRTQGY